MSFPEPTLQALSLAAITKHIWDQWDLSTPLTDIWVQWDLSTPLIKITHASAQKNGIEEMHDDALKTYSRHVIAAYNGIMAIKGLPETEKVQVACAFVKLEQNLLQWAKDIVLILHKPKVKNNIAYCLAKTVVTTNLTVHRERTIFNVLFDSYGRVLLNGFGCGNICVLSVYNFNKFIEDGKYRKHNWLSRRIRNELRFYKPMEHWLIRMRLMAHVRNVTFTKMELLMNAVNQTKFEVFNHLLCQLSNRYYTLLPARIYSLLLFHALLNGREAEAQAEVRTVLFLLDKLQNCDKQLWIRILQHWFREIILWNFCSYDPEYSVVYFQEACESVSLDVCTNTLIGLLEDLCLTQLDSYGDTALYLKRRAVFIEIWRRTPVKAKQMIMDFFEKDFLHIYEHKDFVLLSILVTDTEFSPEQCSSLVLTAVLHIQETEQDVNEFLALLPERYRSIKNKVSKRQLKRYLSRYLIQSKKGIRFILKTELGLDSFREELFEDRHCVTNILSGIGDDFREELFEDRHCVTDILSGMGDGFTEEHASNFLNWGLKDGDSILKFIREKVIREQWIVDILKKYLVRSTHTYKDESLLNFLVRDAEERLKFKKIVREDTQFMLDLLDKILLDSVAEITGVLDCLFDPNEQEERGTFIEAFLLSERGRQAIYRLVSSEDDIKHIDLYTKHCLEQNLHTMKCFKDHWLVPFNIMHKVVEILMGGRIESKAPTLFPHQGEDDGAFIVTRNLMTFLTILNRDVDVDELMATITELPQERSFTTYYQLNDDLGL